jgi:hypothetical protein
MVAGAKVEVGNLTTPGGKEYRGFKVTIGGHSDPERTYEDIRKILRKNAGELRAREEKTDGGKFKSFTVET